MDINKIRERLRTYLKEEGVSHSELAMKIDASNSTCLTIIIGEIDRGEAIQNDILHKYDMTENDVYQKIEEFLDKSI